MAGVLPMTRRMSDLAPAPSRLRGPRCPTCGARVTSVASWCSLCFADLRPDAPASAEVAAPATTTADAPGTTSGASAEVDAPATTTADVGDADAPEGGAADVERVADQLLAELAVTSGTSVRPRFSVLATTTGRVVAMLVGTVAATALGFGLLALGGALL